MKISEYIEELRRIMGEHGDIEVQKERFDGNRITAECPGIAHEKILTGRERKPSFWHRWDAPNSKGANVVKL